ncbi:MAG: diguanylate cyclase [Chloroflexi bacterium]|nr:diguanylate cyclase [Chloroflexota bacterium]
MAKLSRIRMQSPRGWPQLPLLSSVRGRIITGFGFLILILAIVVAGSAWLAREQTDALNKIEENATVVDLLQRAQQQHTQGILLLESYLASGDGEIIPEFRSRLNQASDSIGEALLIEETETALTAGIDANEEVDRLKEILAAMNATSVTIEGAIAARERGDLAGAEEMLAAVFPQIIDLSASIAMGVEDELKEVSFLHDQSTNLANVAFWLLMIAGAVSAILSVAAAVSIARSILTPLSSLESAALAVAGGDLEARAPTAGPRELARLGVSFNQMTESLLKDITARKRAEEALEKESAEIEALNRSLEEKVRQRTRELQDSEERTRLIIDTASDAFISMDAGGLITDWNAQAEATFGWSREEALGRKLSDTIIPSELRPEHLRGLRHFLATGEGPVLNKRIEITALHRDGHEFPVELAIWAVRSGEAYTFNAFVHDITERKRADEALRLTNEELQERNQQLLDARARAATDGLTGLFNHRTFQEKVRELVARAQADGDNVSLIMLDIDGFKGVNDSLGHQAGDEILRLMAQTLTDVVHSQDAYRYGGDEFAVLLPGTDGPKGTRIAERLRRAVAKRTGGNGTKVTVSLGIADFPHTASSAEQLIYGADAAMYWAKSAGKNRVGDWSELIGRRADGTLPWYAADRSVKAPDVVAVLVAALAAKDPVTSAHTERCSWYTAKLAEELGLGEEETSVVRLASLLHDIGKLAVPDDILCKPGPLNEDEWAQMKRHPTAALHILGQIHSISEATPAIHHHHEHFDGSGYPDGLAGEDIPLASRILLVTDAFDAMTTDRPYRRAMPVEAAVEELERNSGSQFDPVVVEAFLRILARDGAQPLLSMRSAATKAAASVRTG